MAVSVKENCSLKGLLVKTIVTNVSEQYLFESRLFDLQSKLQSVLDSNLKFKAKVHDFEFKNVNAFGKVSFEDEKNVYRTLEFAIGRVPEILSVN